MTFLWHGYADSDAMQTLHKMDKPHQPTTKYEIASAAMHMTQAETSKSTYDECIWLLQVVFEHCGGQRGAGTALTPQCRLEGCCARLWCSPSEEYAATASQLGQCDLADAVACQAATERCLNRLVVVTTAGQPSVKPNRHTNSKSRRRIKTVLLDTEI